MRKTIVQRIEKLEIDFERHELISDGLSEERVKQLNNRLSRLEEIIESMGYYIPTPK